MSRQQCTIKAETGLLYFYKYRIKKTDQWKIAITGLQPLNENEVKADDDLSQMTEVRLKDSESVSDQLNEQLKKLLFTFHKSAKNFYRDSNRGRMGNRY